MDAAIKAKRQYDAGTVSRRTANWLARSTGPNREIETSLVKLRDRHRDLARNNPWARRAINAVINNAIGPGIRAQWSNTRRQKRWSEWFETTACDASGRLDGYGLQALALRTVVESGECLIRRRPRRPDDGLPVPLQLQILEPDYLDHAKTEALPSGGWISQGVEHDARGRRVAYWLFPEHPGDPITGTGAGQSARYPASEFLHIYRLERPGQVRGVPWGTGAMMRLRMLDDYQDAQLERQRLAACFVAFVRETDPTMETQDEYELLSKLEPGAIELLPPGKDVSFASPPQPNDDKEFTANVLRAVASDYGLSYEVLTNDLSNVNFSSARMGFQEFARNIDAWRWQMLAPQFLNPLAAWFLEAESLAGVTGKAETPLWTAPARTLVDPAKEVPALRDQVRAGFMSLPEAIRKMGYDPDLLIQEQAEFMGKLDALGISFDSDPRRDNPAAMPMDEAAQSDAEAAADPQEPTDTANAENEQP